MKFFRIFLFGLFMCPLHLLAQTGGLNTPDKFLSYQQMKLEEEKVGQDNFAADEKGRRNYNIDKNWFYLQDNLQEVDKISQSKAYWKRINLPHTWNRFDNLDGEPGYRRDASWYEKGIFIPMLSYKQNVILHFDGANITSKIFVNGKYAGGHVGGYVGFDVDITPFINEGKENIIDVRVDNSINRNIIPSQKSDFYIYGGLVRHVWLKILPSSYIQRFHAVISNVSTASAETKIETIIFCAGAAEGTLSVKLINPAGKAVEEKQAAEKMKSGENIVSLNLPKLHTPELWSPDTPNLYKVEVRLEHENKLIDSTSDLIGYRWYEFKSHGAFYLNGKKLLIKGTCRHEDYAGYGEAMPDSLQWKDMRMIKEMGANFVRLAHYPQSPVVYRACDELGIMVWDELPWCRGGEGGEEWKSNTKRLLTEQINQNYNHPSIIIWSLGNELDWLPDFPNGSIPDSLDAFLRILNNTAHKMDPSRLTAVRKYEGAAKIVDVFSPSIWAGWYSGVYTNYQKAIEGAQAKYPHLLHMEYGGSSLLGRHTENPITGEGILNPDEWDEKANKIKVSSIANMGDWSENYIVDLFDWYLRYTMQTTTFAGNVQWAFKDFPTPLRPENAIPYMNLKGLLDRGGHPKDAYYVYKSYWTKKPEFCYIESHTWTERSGSKNLKRTIRVYSNCDSVELYLNSESLGTRKKDITKFPASGLTWDLQFKDGNNNLKAVGYGTDSETALDTLTVNYTYHKAGTPSDIKLTSERLTNGDYLITATVVDENGQRCLDYNKRVYFALSGSGRLMENYGTVTGSSVIECANGKAQIEFKPDGNKAATIEVRNQNFQGDYITLND
jgi:beta-galactosidase